MPHYYVRIGALAEVHAAASPIELDRGRRVLVRTDRGVELGEIVGPCREGREVRRTCPQILRGTTDQDEWLIRRLDRYKRAAIEACRKELEASGSTSTLLDVDHLFDGSTLVMHFLGPVDEAAQRISRKVAERYESVVGTRRLQAQIQQGCGPGCGTDAAGGSTSGCGTACGTASGCATCSARHTASR